MKLHFGFERHQSKLATLITFFQSGIIGLILFWIFFNIPSFIVLICGVEEPVPAILFGIMSAVAIVAFIGILFIDADRVDDFMSRKKNIKNNVVEVQQTDEDIIRSATRRAYISSLVESELANKEKENKNIK